ncbi:hypothetical protein ACOZLB_001915, partial [Campylobacter jejuni]
SGGLFCYTLNYPLSKHDLKDLKERCNEQSWEQGLHVPEKGKTFLSQKNIPYWEVKTWTTDGFYRETVEMVQYRKEEGCQVVEMECSALAACAKFRKVTWAMLLFSADTLADPHKYQEREWGKTNISIALELALDAVLSVVEE